MKKVFLIFTFAFTMFALNAQHTTPRTGTGANNDNTYRALTFKYKSHTDAVGLDTLKLNLDAYHTQVTCASVVDSFAVNFTSVANCYLGDVCEITVINSASGTCVKWAGSNIAISTIPTIGGGASQLYLAASKRATIRFVFDGTKFVEQCRMAQQ